MQQRKLGQTGTTVSAVGIGAMSLTSFYGPIDTDQSQAVLARAMELGIDHLDTSNMYGSGLSEERIGKFLADHGSEARDFFKIATKGGISKDAEGNRCFDNSAEHLKTALDESLKRLGVERVELYYVHRRDPSIPIEDVTGTLADLIKAGKIGQFGYSEIAPTSLEVAGAVHPVGAVQSEYSLSTRAVELGLTQRCDAMGTSLVAFSPVGRSLLTDTPHSYEKSQSIDFLKTNPRFMEPNRSRNVAATEGLRNLASEMGVATASLAIAWLLHQGEHVLTIPGTRSVAHLEELAAGADIKLTDADLATIEELLPVGWAHGDRYNVGQWVGPEKYC